MGLRLVSLATRPKGQMETESRRNAESRQELPHVVFRILGQHLLLDSQGSAAWQFAEIGGSTPAGSGDGVPLTIYSTSGSKKRSTTEGSLRITASRYAAISSAFDGVGLITSFSPDQLARLSPWLSAHGDPSACGVTVAQRSAILSPSKRQSTKP